MHNLGTVIRFEIGRTLKKKSFWLAALAIPVVAVFVGVIIFFSNKTTDEQSQNLAKEQFTIGITDESHLISPKLLESVHARPIATPQEGEQAVKSGQLDAYFHYPKDISKDTVSVRGKNVGLFKNGRYEDLAGQLLKQSVSAKTNPGVATVLQGSTKFNSLTYTSDGQVDKGFLNVIAPGVFLVLFYFMIATFGSQILTSITEEKENRVIEMILATIKPTTLLVGKLFSVISLAFIQMFVILIPTIVGYLFFKDQLALPNLDLSTLPLDPTAIGLGAVIFMVSFLLFTGILMTLGAAMPTAKEAGGFMGGVFALLFGPLYAAPLFVTSPDSTIVQFLSYFPLTAPIPLLLRNAVGNLPLHEALIAIGILLLTTLIVISIGVRIFKFGALEYSRKLSMKEVMGRKS
ncbi:MAG TPA: ABC transporter permease [Candidatus Saccharimonadales bacterium]|nr:ABC transporter permease [Candidatus Saccharimonadales bacterium]